ncbi:MAG: AI-2E family transporter [Salinibacter sp.]
MSDSSSLDLSQRPYATLALVVSALLGGYLLIQMTGVLLTVFAGVLLAVFLAGLADHLCAYTPLPRPVALVLVIGALGSAVAGVWALTGPDLSSQINALAALLPNAADRLSIRLQGWAEQYPWIRQLLSPSDLIPTATSVLGSVTNVFSVTVDVLVNVLIIVFIGLYGAAAPRPYVESTVSLVPPSRRDRAREVLHALGRALRWWVLGRLALMGVVGILTAVGLSVVGLPSPMALGLLAALCSFVPYLGPVLAVGPALLVAFPSGSTTILSVVGVYGGVQVLESYLIAPLVQERAVHIPPAAVITAQFAGGVAAGAVGVLLATPLAIVGIVLVQTLYVEDVLGDAVALLGEH